MNYFWIFIFLTNVLKCIKTFYRKRNFTLNEGFARERGREGIAEACVELSDGGTMSGG